MRENLIAQRPLTPDPRGHLRCSWLLSALASAFCSSPSAQRSWRQCAYANYPPASAPRTLPGVCIDVQSSDKLIQRFADRLRETIGASGAFSLASSTDSCSLRLHVPGNLLRFDTAGDIMVSTVVIVTSSSDRYFSTSISACRATNLKPCVVRAVAAAKLALLMGTDGAT